MPGHGVLLVPAAVVLNGQDNRVGRALNKQVHRWGQIQYRSVNKCNVNKDPKGIVRGHLHSTDGAKSVLKGKNHRPGF